MTPKPTVSVIIVNYQADAYLAKAIKYISNVSGVEIIVIDNSPPHKNLGFSRAVNKGVKQSRGQYLCLLNPDTEITKESLFKLVETSRKYSDRAIIAPRLTDSDGLPQASVYNKQSIWNAVKEYWLGLKGAYTKYIPGGKQSLPVHTAVAASWLVPRAVWDKLGGLSEKYFLYFEDLDLCDRANQLGIQIIYDPSISVKHAHGISSETNPNTRALFQSSAITYHGLFKKLIIDFVIRLRDFFVPPVSTKKIAGIILLYAAIVLVFAVLGYLLLPARFSPSSLISDLYRHNFLLWFPANFDGEHYLNIATHGYQVIQGQSEYAFFPLLPVLINLLSRTGLDLYLSARLITLLSAAIFIFYLVKWASAYLKNPLHLLWLVLLSPGTIFLVSIYTEPLFLMLAILTFYYGDRKEWGKAAIFAALATATRISGVFLVLFLLVKLFKSKVKPLTSLSYLLVSCLGILGYMTYLYTQTSDPLAWYHAQSGWEKSTATPPWVTVSNYAKALTTEFVPDLTHLVVAIEVVVTLLVIHLTYLFIRKSSLDSAYKYYVSGSLALPLVTGSLGSMPRFSLALFPIFMMIPHLTRPLRLIYYSLFVIMSIIGIILFARGYWYA